MITLVERQIGRQLSAPADIAAVCAAGYPAVIRNSGFTANGEPFPTLYWLTCPKASRAISRLEAAGLISKLQEQLEGNSEWRAALLDSDAAYRAARGAGRGLTGGIAGTRNVFKLKCLHAHAADWLAAKLNPIGRLVLELAPLPAECDECRRL